MQKNDHKLEIDTWKKLGVQEIQKEQHWGQHSKGKELNLKDILYWKRYEKIQKKYFPKLSANKSAIRKQGNKIEHASRRNAERLLMAHGYLPSDEHWVLLPYRQKTHQYTEILSWESMRQYFNLHWMQLGCRWGEVAAASLTHHSSNGDSEVSSQLFQRHGVSPFCLPFQVVLVNLWQPAMVAHACVATAATEITLKI